MLHKRNTTTSRSFRLDAYFSQCMKWGLFGTEKVLNIPNGTECRENYTGWRSTGLMMVCTAMVHYIHGFLHYGFSTIDSVWQLIDIFQWSSIGREKIPDSHQRAGTFLLGASLPAWCLPAPIVTSLPFGPSRFEFGADLCFQELNFIYLFHPWRMQHHRFLCLVFKIWSRILP